MFGIKVHEGKRSWWITETGASNRRNARGIWKFDSQMGAEMARGSLQKMNPDATLTVERF